MAKERWQTRMEELRRDNRSGAAEIATSALDLLIDAVGDSLPSGAISYRRWLLQLGRQLVAAQPSMAVLFRLVNDMLWACHEAVGAPEIRQRALDFLQAHRADSAAAAESLAANAVDHLQRHEAIITYSRSSTVARILVALAERRRSLRVICGEGRPMLEGQTLASELAWAGIQVRLGVDMALFGWLPEATVFLIGADSLMAAGLVNKLGTAPLARAAYALEIPIIVVCTMDKLLPNDYVVTHSLRNGDPDEIMPVSSDNITVLNPYFDVTPLDLLTAVITEKGVLWEPELTDALSRIKTYPGLRGR
jgi:translation initiation factor eIF-2B subunit delta